MQGIGIDLVALSRMRETMERSGETSQDLRQAMNVVNPGNYLSWRDRSKSFTDLAAFTWSSLTFTGEAPEIVQCMAIPLRKTFHL